MFIIIVTRFEKNLVLTNSLRYLNLYLEKYVYLVTNISKKI